MSKQNDVEKSCEHLDEKEEEEERQSQIGDNDSDDEIEQPRLEDSRGQLLQLAHEQPFELVMLLLPQCKPDRQDPLLSSTMMLEASNAGAEQDWPTASSIRLFNSRESVTLSERLNNAGIGLEMSINNGDVSSVMSCSASDSASAPAVAVPVPVPSAPLAVSEAAAPTNFIAESTASSVVSGVSSAASFSTSGGSADLDSAPRLRVLASNSTASSSSGGPQHLLPEQQLQQASQHQQQPHHSQPALGLLQVCRLTMDVLSESHLLRDDAARWLTPELLCDKVCDRLYHPRPVSPAMMPGGGDSTTSDVPDLEFDSPVGRVRHWLTAGNGALGGSPLRRSVNNTV